MMNLTKLLLIISSIFLLSGCALVTRINCYAVCPIDENYSMIQSEDLSVTGELEITEKRKLFFPLIYEKSIWKGPYRLRLIIKGNVDDIEIISSKIIFNLGEQERILDLSKNDFEYEPLPDGTPLFYLKTHTDLDYPWKDIKEVDFIFEFYSIKNGIKTRYLAKKNFKPCFETMLIFDKYKVIPQLTQAIIYSARY